VSNAGSRFLYGLEQELDADEADGLDFEEELERCAPAFPGAGEFGSARCPPLDTETVGRFPRYQRSIGALPLKERQKIAALARRIVASHTPGCKPVVGISLLGHADRDPRRGPGFEKNISVERAVAVKKALNEAISGIAGGPLAGLRSSAISAIDWRVGGAGATRPVVPAAVSEDQRVQNRRVEVFLRTRLPDPPPMRKGPLMLPPEILSGRRFVALQNFSRNRFAPAPHHRQLIERVARYVAARSPAASPIREIRIVGHTEATQAEPAGQALGRRRAEAVAAALATRMDRLKPGLSRRVRIVLQSAGALRPRRDAAGPAGPGLNRRVEVFLAAHAIASFAEAPPAPPTPSIRTCCILAPHLGPFGLPSNVVDPASLGLHRASSEKNGLIYSGKAGFLDLGHIRDMCDVTKFIFDQISAAGGAATTVATARGEAILTAPVPPSEWLSVAMDITNDDGVGYEIFTYWVLGPGERNSAFSPEDLCSNWLGTRLAETAIRGGGNFNTAVTTALGRVVADLDGQAPNETRNAFNRISLCWVTFSDASDLLNDDYLKRRNFTALPWKTGHSSDKPTPTWLTGNPAATTKRYQYVHTRGRTIFDFDFGAHITSIKADARRRYGPNFENPIPCP
jgi:outer membrane protein OmpA-like peptidoglycan-associated protein